MPPESQGHKANIMTSSTAAHKTKLGVGSGVFIPVVLNIISILMFLRFGSILGRIGLLGIFGRLFSPSQAYRINLILNFRIRTVNYSVFRGFYHDALFIGNSI